MIAILVGYYLHSFRCFPMKSRVNSINPEQLQVTQRLLSRSVTFDYLGYLVYTASIVDNRQGAEILTHD